MPTFSEGSPFCLECVDRFSCVKDNSCMLNRDQQLSRERDHRLDAVPTYGHALQLSGFSDGAKIFVVVSAITSVEDTPSGEGCTVYAGSNWSRVSETYTTVMAMLAGHFTIIK